MEQDIKNLLKLLVFLVVIIGLVGLVSYMIFGGLKVDDVRKFVMQFGPLSPLVFVVITIFLVVFPPAPNDIMAIAAGILFGFWTGLGLILISFTIGSLISWGIGRKFGRPLMKKISVKKVEEYTKIFTKHGLFAVFVARLIPIISFDLVSYAAGIFKIHPIRFAIVTFLGMIPNVFLLVKIGDAIFSEPLMIFLYASIMAGVSIGGIYIWRKYKDDSRIKTIFAL